MSDGLAAVQSRVAELQSLLGVSRQGTPTSTQATGTGAGSSTSTGTGAAASDFAAALQSALASGALGDGTSTAGLADSLGTGAAGSSTATNAANLLAALARLAKSADASSGLSAATGSGAGGSTPARTSADVGAQAVTLAAQYTGVPYKWGGEDPATGVDCSGLVQHVYGSLGVKLPRVAEDQAKAGTAVASLDQAQPGDLVFFGSPAHHVGIYVGDDKMIDAPRTGKTVGVHALWGTPSSIRRVATAPTTVAATPGSTSVAGLGSAPTVAAASAATSVVGAAATSAGAGPYAALFAQAGSKYGVDPALLSAVAKAESAYNPRAVSSAGAQGLMQLMPSTARSLGVDAYDPAQAVDGAARLMSQLLDRFGGRVDLALAGYNAGPGAVQRYGGVPPYAETQTYVRRVTQYWEALR